AINNIKVFQPRVCNDTDTPGACLYYAGGFQGVVCEIYKRHADEAGRDPSSCPSSNVGGTLALARTALTGDTDPNNQRLDAFWVVITLLGGPANSTDATGTYPYGFCPNYTYFNDQTPPQVRPL